jgi:hypothetical protein
MEFPPGTQVVQDKSRDGRTVMHSVCTIDEHGLRHTPVTNPDRRKRFVAIFADSLAFGEGLSDEDTLPAFVGKHTNDHTPYNFGLPAHGPQQMFRRLVENRVRPFVAQNEGLGIYLFIDDHVYRAAGSLRMYNLWCSPYPCYQLTDGKLEYHGSFEEARPVRNLVYRFLWKSHAVRNWQLEWPPLANGTLELTAALIRKSREAFERTFQGSTFYVLMYPRFTSRVGPKMLGLLARDHVQSLTFPDLFSDSEWANRLPDGHPSAAMQEKLAMALVARLGLK